MGGRYDTLLEVQHFGPDMQGIQPEQERKCDNESNVDALGQGWSGDDRSKPKTPAGGISEVMAGGS